MAERRISNLGEIETAKAERIARLSLACATTALSLVCAYDASQHGFDRESIEGLAAFLVLTPIMWKLVRNEHRRVIELQKLEHM
jgi:hypothetical protein